MFMTDSIAPGPELMPSILIVSADHRDRRWLFRALRTSGWACRTAGSTRSAFNALSRTVATFLVICEQNLPDGDWKDLLKRATGEMGQPLLIVTSTHADDRLWVEVLNVGGFDLLMKPFDKTELGRVMEMALRQWKACRIAPVATAECGAATKSLWSTN